MSPKARLFSMAERFAREQKLDNSGCREVRFFLNMKSNKFLFRFESRSKSHQISVCEWPNITSAPTSVTVTIFPEYDEWQFREI